MYNALRFVIGVSDLYHRRRISADVLSDAAQRRR